MISESKIFPFIFSFLFTFAACVKDKSDSDKTAAPLIESTVTDVEGNIYKTVKIGDQWWMAENLNVRSYRSGVPILELTSAELWLSGNPGYCQFENNSTAPGLLYNYYAIEHEDSLAPEGWHIATEADWKQLELTLGMPLGSVDSISWRKQNSVGDKLKIQAPEGWTVVPGVWGNNESGFTALAGGCRLFNANWSNPGLNSVGLWWTATKHDEANAWFRQLDYKNFGVFRFYVPKQYGMSVRCVKNN